MTVIQEIYKWSLGLQKWQQDAIARLYEKPSLDQRDIDDLCALLKSEFGIPDPQERSYRFLAAAQVAAPVIPERLIQLTGIRDLSHVNALAPGQNLQISATGLTVIFGENGAGKSGYSRVLKKACRARDQREPILPDARKEHPTPVKATATFDVLLDGEPAELTWANGDAPPDELSEIAIFDTHCANAYVDNQGDFAYVPYGLDILTGLVLACTQMRAQLENEKRQISPDGRAFSSFGHSNTRAGSVASRLLIDATSDEVDAASIYTPDDVSRYAAIRKALLENDPKKRSHEMRLQAARLGDLKARVVRASGILADANIIDLMKLIDTAKTAREAAELASKAFMESPSLLPGTGGEHWKTLIEAARSFSTISHAGHPLSSLPPGSPCPLCQNQLGDDGSSRLRSFDEFLKGAAERNSAETREKAV